MEDDIKPTQPRGVGTKGPSEIWIFLFIKKIWYGSNKTTNILSQHLLHDWKIGLWFPNEIKYFQCQGSILYAK